MRAPAKTLPTTTVKARPTAPKGYTVSQTASYKAWVAAHPWPKQSKAQQQASLKAWIKKHPFKTSSSKGGKKTTVVKKASTTKRTLALNPHNVAPEGSNVKLGRKPAYAAADKPRLVLEDYLTGSAVPSVVDFASEVLTWPMYGNDNIGDCTCACVGHQIQAWTRYTGTEVDVPEADIIQLYSDVSGYDPNQVQPDGTNPTDQGASCQDVLTYWRKSGVPVAGHKILAFAQLRDLTNVKEALWMFGSVYLGINFPGSAMDQFNAGQPWTVVQGAQIEGGHAIPLQYAGNGTAPYQVVTWGQLQGMDQGFLDAYCEEAWVVITDDWLDKNGHTPEGLDLQQLGADLSQLTGDPNPFPAPPAPQPPAPPAPPAPAPVPAPSPAPAPGPAPSPDPSILQDIERAAEVIIADVEKIL